MEKKRIVPVVLSVVFVLVGLYFLYLGTVQIVSSHPQRFFHDPQTVRAAKGKVSTIVIASSPEQRERNRRLKTNNSNSFPVTSPDEQHVESSKQPLPKEEVFDLVHSRIDEVFTILNELGEKHGWDFQNPADYHLMKNELEPYVSFAFAENELKRLAEHYYCNCDIRFRPFYTGTVGFSVEQKTGEQIRASVLEPANSMENTAYVWTVVLQKIDGRWKLHSLAAEPFRLQDLQLTIQEAKEILEYEFQGKVEYIKSYTSREANGTAYLFKITTPYIEFYSAISAKDTKLLEDYE